MVDNLSDDFTTLQNLLKLYNETITAGGNEPAGFIEDIVGLIIGAFQAVFGKLFSNISGVVSDVQTRIKNGLNVNIGDYSGSLGGFVNYVRGWIGDRIADVKTTVNGVATSVINKLGGTITDVSTWINGATNDIKTRIVSKVNDVSTWINTAQNSITNFVNGNVNRVSNWIDTAKTNITNNINDIKADVNNTVSNIGNSISGGIDRLIGALSGLASGIGNAIGDKIRDAISGITTGINNVLNSIRDRIGEIISGVTQTVKDTIDLVKHGFDTTVNNVKAIIADEIKNAKDNITSVYNTIATWVGNVIEALRSKLAEVKEAITNAYESAKQYIGEKIRAAIEFLQRVWEDFAAWARDKFGQLGDKIGSFLANVKGGFENLYNDMSPKIRKIADKLSNGEYMNLEDLLVDIFDIVGVPEAGSEIYNVIATFARLQAVFNAQFAGIQLAAQKHAMISLALEPVNMGDMAQAVFREKASYQQYQANVKLSGVTQDKGKAVFEAARALPTPGAIQTAFLRGEIDEKEHDKQLAAYGYTDENITLFKALYWIIPTPNDLIRMAVREVFTPEIAERFGQFEDFPKAFVDWSKKIGLSEQWAKNYWAAHWDLPSPQMGFEMLHRGVIDDNELKLLLRALDVMPYWRERLIQISYSPLTRVDVRRMYQFGVIDEKQVKHAYLDLGYDEEKASWLTEFTKRYSAPEDGSQLDEFKTLARSTYSQAYRKKIISQDEYREFLLGLKLHPDDVNLLISLDDYAILQDDKLFSQKEYRKDYEKLVLEAYDRGLIDNTEAGDMLKDLGYETDEITMQLSLLDYNRQLKLRNMIVNQLHEQYISFIINETQVNQLFGVFNFSSTETGKLLEEWNIEKSFRSKQPPIADLKGFLNRGIITVEEFLDELRGNGYNEKYINWYAVQYAKV